MLRIPAPHSPASEWNSFLGEAESLLNSATPLTGEQFVAIGVLWSTAVAPLDSMRHDLDRMKDSRKRHAPDEEPASLEAIAELQEQYNRLADIQGRCLIFARTAFPHSPNHSNPDPLGDTALSIARKEGKYA
jgi:hypothetical protein